MISSDSGLGHRVLAEKIARDLLRIGALAVRPHEPFVWASGIESPVYCDNRLTMGHPDVRTGISAGFCRVMESNDLRPDLIVGTATAGIPHAAWLAGELRLPMAYVRSRSKEHGKQKLVEGEVRQGAKVVVIEDLVSTGRSSLGAVEAVRSVAADVLAVLSIFSYGLPAAVEAFAGASVPHFSLTSFETLVHVASLDGQLPPDQVRRMHDWHSTLSTSFSSI